MGSIMTANPSDPPAGPQGDLLSGGPPRPDSLTDFVFDLVQNAIVSKALAPGSAVTESELAARLGVSKTPVRESMIRLKEIGLLVPDGRRLRVITPSRQLIQDAYEFRLCIEPQAARLAAQRAQPAERQRITVAGARRGGGEPEHDGGAKGDPDRHFHLQIADATQNDFLAGAVERSHLFTLTLTLRDLTEVVDRGTRDSDHVAIAKAIAEGEEDGAASAMEHHITMLRESALERFGR
jgi:DNA-binding GntR family transcriptional regulator